MRNNNTIDIASLFMQALSLEILFKDYNNVDLMHELQHQDKNYFERIISNQNEILEILRKEKNDENRNN